MKKEDKHEYLYNEEVQRFFIRYLLSNPDAFARCQNIIKYEYWDQILQPSMKFIIDYVNKYHVLPSWEAVKAFTNQEFLPLDEIAPGDFILEVGTFCKHKAYELTILESVELMNKGCYGTVLEKIRECDTISIQKDLGLNYFDGISERLERLRNKDNIIPTGWKTIDDVLYGGVEKGSLTLFCGSSGSGKSLFLQNQAINWVEEGKNVIYITLELSEDLVSLRLDSMILKIPTKKVMSDPKDAEFKITTMNMRKKYGKLTVKKMPEAGTSANDIRAYLKEFEIQNGYKPDGLIVDYLDLLYPIDSRISVSDTFTKDKLVSEELRRLAGDYDVPCMSASQLNRGAIPAGEELDMSHIAGGISKINTSDNVIYIFKSSTMDELGMYKIFFMKTRSSSGIGKRAEMKYNRDYMRIEDFDEDEHELKESRSPKHHEDISNKIKNLANKSANNMNSSKIVSSVTKPSDERKSTQPPNDVEVTPKKNNFLGSISRIRNSISPSP